MHFVLGLDGRKDMMASKSLAEAIYRNDSRNDEHLCEWIGEVVVVPSVKRRDVANICKI